MDDVISRQEAVDALCDEYCDGRQDCKHYPKCENLKAIQNLPSAHPEVRTQMSSADCISRQAVYDALDNIKIPMNASWYPYYHQALNAVSKLPPAQPDLTDEQAIGHLQASGWMQSHDKQMYEMGLKERLADDSDSYDALLPFLQPEIIACGDCKHWICHDRRCGFWNHGVKPLDWCCHAERRTDEGVD